LDLCVVPGCVAGDVAVGGDDLLESIEPGLRFWRFFFAIG